MDEDGDGLVSFEDFMRMLSTQNTPVSASLYTKAALQPVGAVGAAGGFGEAILVVVGGVCLQEVAEKCERNDNDTRHTKTR